MQKKTPSKLTPKIKQKNTPNSEKKLKKQVNKKGPVNSPFEKTLSTITMKTPPATENKIQKQKTPKSQNKKGLKTPKSENKLTSNGIMAKAKTPTPKKRRQSLLVKQEESETDESFSLESPLEEESSPLKTPLVALKKQKQVVQVKQEESDEDESISLESPSAEKKSIKKRKQLNNTEAESTSPKRAKRSSESSETDNKKAVKVRSSEKRKERRQQRRLKDKELYLQLKEGNASALSNAAKIEEKLAQLKNRNTKSKNVSRMIRKYSYYLNMINAIKSGKPILTKKPGETSPKKTETSPKKTKANTKPEKSPEIKKQSRQQQQQNHEVFIGNLPYDVKPNEIKEFFKEIGEVVNVTIPEKKGIGFVQFRNEETCQKALTLHLNALKGRKINVYRKNKKTSPKKKL